jgi:hypothetical protein
MEILQIGRPARQMPRPWARQPDKHNSRYSEREDIRYTADH